MTAAEIRATLWEGIRNLREGKTTPAQLNLVSRRAGAQIATIKVALRLARLAGSVARA
jgi:hypothetical protein